jgi:hypothetical protein
MAMTNEEWIQELEEITRRLSEVLAGLSFSTGLDIIATLVASCAVNHGLPSSFGEQIGERIASRIDELRDLKARASGGE